ncbi:UvrD-helicase domain-containing protein [Accumulibacter sp.]|uniref:UvrD-helicase domain-containing protein n=1 Tax=Accumulibacter sp. TaxID=2053492 RepID=UPI002607B208|nr:UvrD-helicase domain-containing protein [Accumulibacter sp.]
MKSKDLPPEEADQQRERLLAGCRWILVDEYQDTAPEQYELTSALAGRTRPDEDGRINPSATMTTRTSTPSMAPRLRSSVASRPTMPPGRPS